MMDRAKTVDREDAINELTDRMRQHVCVGFAILESLEQLREASLPSKGPCVGQDDSHPTRADLASGWIAAGY